MKTTEMGYINRNNQKNIEKTNLHGSDHNQVFYQMECQLCRMKYFANGTDIFQKKCPKCQGGKYSATVAVEMINTLKDFAVGTEFSRSEIVGLVSEKFGRNPDSVIPSDYCYNRLNSGINYEKYLHLFEYTDRNTYKYLGVDYPYTGKIYHKPKGGCEICVGEWVDGKIVKSGKEPFEAEKPIKEPVSGKNQHKTKRDISVGLRFKILKRDNFKCCACGASPAKDPNVELHIDHIIPWSKGGETTEENLQTLCSKCNLGKSDLV